MHEKYKEILATNIGQLLLPLKVFYMERGENKANINEQINVYTYLMNDNIHICE